MSLHGVKNASLASPRALNRARLQQIPLRVVLPLACRVSSGVGDKPPAGLQPSRSHANSCKPYVTTSSCRSQLSPQQRA